jgi:hypothetical protein
MSNMKLLGLEYFLHLPEPDGRIIQTVCRFCFRAVAFSPEANILAIAEFAHLKGCAAAVKNGFANRSAAVQMFPSITK